MNTNKYNTVIVGGGIAGLTSAAYLSRAGQKVLLIEKNEKCGGLVSSFSRDGFHFEAGVRALEDAGIILPMLKDLGIHLEMVKSTVSVGIEDRVIQIDDLGSIQTYRELLADIYPESKKEIDALIKIILKIMKHMEVLYGIENPAFKDIQNDREFLFKQLLPWLPKFIFTIGKINRMNMPVEGYVEAIVKDPSLRDIIAQHFFKNTPTFFALSYFSLYLDYFYPKGGVGTLAEAVTAKINEFGGEIRNESSVISVDLSAQQVTDQNHVTYEYDNLIWAADLKTFYKISDTKGLKPKLKTKFEALGDLMQSRRGGDSVFTLFLEVDEPLETFGSIATGHFFYTPSRQGLGETHWSEMRELIRNFEHMEKDKVYMWLDKFTRLNTYEISIPGLKNSELAPPGKTGMIISFLGEYELFKAVETAGWYEEFKTELEKRILNVISDSIYPNLKDKVIAQFSFSPISIEKWTGSSEGAITGWSFEEPVPVANKIQHSARSVLTPIPSVFVAGQWAYSPAGVPMSILTGKLAADKVLKRRTE